MLRLLTISSHLCLFHFSLSPLLACLARIAVMYGSQTGNAQSIAEGIHDGCKKRGLVSTLLACDGWKKVPGSAEA